MTLHDCMQQLLSERRVVTLKVTEPEWSKWANQILLDARFSLFLFKVVEKDGYFQGGMLRGAGSELDEYMPLLRAAAMSAKEAGVRGSLGQELVQELVDILRTEAQRQQQHGVESQGLTAAMTAEQLDDRWLRDYLQGLKSQVVTGPDEKIKLSALDERVRDEGSRLNVKARLELCSASTLLLKLDDRLVGWVPVDTLLTDSDIQVDGIAHSAREGACPYHSGGPVPSHSGAEAGEANQKDTLCNDYMSVIASMQEARTHLWKLKKDLSVSGRASRAEEGIYQLSEELSGMSLELARALQYGMEYGEWPEDSQPGGCWGSDQIPGAWEPIGDERLCTFASVAPKLKPEEQLEEEGRQEEFEFEMRKHCATCCVCLLPIPAAQRCWSCLQWVGVNCKDCYREGQCRLCRVHHATDSNNWHFEVLAALNAVVRSREARACDPGTPQADLFFTASACAIQHYCANVEHQLVNSLERVGKGDGKNSAGKTGAPFDQKSEVDRLIGELWAGTVRGLVPSRGSVVSSSSRGSKRA